jgi:esterase/lipase
LQLEILKLKKENEQLTSQLQSELEKNEKNISNIKQKADLKVASIKKQYENETTTKMEELNSKNYDLDSVPAPALILTLRKPEKVKWAKEYLLHETVAVECLG